MKEAGFKSSMLEVAEELPTGASENGDADNYYADQPRARSPHLLTKVHTTILENSIFVTF